MNGEVVADGEEFVYLEASVDKESGGSTDIKNRLHKAVVHSTDCGRCGQPGE